MPGRIEERAKDVRSLEPELSPKRILRPASPFGNRCEHQRDSTVSKVGAGDDILDPIENDGAAAGSRISSLSVNSRRVQKAPPLVSPPEATHRHSRQPPTFP